MDLTSGPGDLKPAARRASSPPSHPHVYGHPMAAYLLIASATDELLVVHPANAPEQWHLPGGIVEQHESPLDTARREALEVLGLDLNLRESDLLSVEWIKASRPRRRNRLAFLFAGPVLTAADTEHIRVQNEELDGWRWASRAEARAVLHPAVAAQVALPLERPGRALYCEIR
ncbi:NUDIX hydrolase [Streptomyces bauhiniae]|uniref:NUDIX hydrolase n=1 Tax=Streptomyces bauhiniae TaxID=2340725 RepID=UPI0033A0E32C